MKALTEDEVDAMWSKRKYRLINLPELAAILNCTREHMVSAQTGRPIPDEVHRAVTNWLGTK